VEELIVRNQTNGHLWLFNTAALATLLLPATDVLSENGNLHIFIKFTQTNSKLGERLEEHVAVMKSRSLTTLAGDMKRLLKDGTGSDFKVKTSDGRTFNVHKAVLAGKLLKIRSVG
jgi:hypothetical protein